MIAAVMQSKIHVLLKECILQENAKAEERISAHAAELEAAQKAGEARIHTKIFLKYRVV